MNFDDFNLPEGAANNPSAPYNWSDDDDDWRDQQADDAYDAWKDAQLETNEKKSSHGTI